MSSKTARQYDSSDATRFTPAPVAVRMLLAMAYFAAAFAVDLLSQRQYSQALGGTAILGSVFTLFPAIRPGLLAATIYLLTWIAFNLIRAFADDAGFEVAKTSLVGEVERSLFGGRLPATTLQHYLYAPQAIQPHDIMLAIVHASFFIVPFVVAAFAWRRRSLLFYRYLRATAVCFGISLVAFTLLPTAPPWMNDAHEITRITRYILPSAASGDAGSEAIWFEPNHLAAMPSVHVAVAVLVFVCVGHFVRWSPVAGGVYALGMSLSVVYLGEHYVIDVILGWFVAIASWRMVSLPKLSGSIFPRGLAASRRR